MADNFYAKYVGFGGGGGAAGVSSLNSLTGALSLVAGSNITITPSGSTLTIAATGGGGGGITALTGDVTASGPGSAAATVVSVGGSSASDVNSSVLSTLAATSSETPNTLVKRDGASGFMAGIVQLLSSSFQFGTLDPFSRTQIWNKASAAVLRLGSWQADGDPTNSSSEGIIVYGDSLTGQPISGNVPGPDEGGYARVKVNRFGLYTIDSTLPYYTGGAYWYRVDDSAMYYKNNAGASVFSVNRASGQTDIKGTLRLDGATSGSVGFKSPAAPAANIDYTLPSNDGSAGQVLSTDGSATLSWAAAAPAASTLVSIYTLTPTDISNKYVTLPAAPTVPSLVLLNVIGGPMQQYGPDYIVTGAQLGWSGLFLDSVLAFGDVLIVQSN